MRLVLPLLALSLSASLVGGPALAKDLCSVPQAEWRPVEDLTAELTAQGWEVANVKVEDGCYEVYAHDASGKRVEVFFDPKTFEQVGSDD
ncbi:MULTISPECIES: PepSY domain-containing protein [Rhodovulum]|uniref:PepSY domain-containing protein n=2 Tax=Rhodovulum TaxID=34008 RepID=A0A8E3AQN7_9RHOB|nr:MULTISPECIES: PepSY domain-containing protein [Rhodovulum]PTW49821.1 hypothetical protein C8N38_10682 [Rhodovulum kholense]RAP41366.1 hypothetical protein BYZ73_10485 [Rhodovulum viride]